MPDRVATLAASARAASVMWRDLLASAGPATWWLPAGACLVGALASGGSITVGLLLGIAWLTLPFGLLRGTLEGLVRGDVADAPARVAIAATSLPLLAILVLVGGASAGLAIVALLAVAIAITWPPVRLAQRPAADLAAEAAIPVLAALAGMILGAVREDVPVTIPWVGLAAGAGWAVALVALATADAAPRTGPTALVGTAGVVGVRGLSITALGGLAVAAVLALTWGWLGILVALGIGLFALVPAMLLLRSDGGGDGDDRVRAVRREMPGALFLLGAWLGALLLQARGVPGWSPWTFAVAVPAVLAGYTLASVIATRIATWRRRLPRTRDDTQLPSVTIIVASHESIELLPTSLAAARSQTYADVTTLVVDAGSTDGSRSESAAWLGADAVHDAGPPPAGWSPPDWAWHAGATAVTSDLVLLVAAGTALAPVATRILVEQLLVRGDDLLSGVLRHGMPTVGERAGTPGLPLVLFGLVPIWWSAITRGRPPALAFAHDGFALVRREAYLEVRTGAGPWRSGAPDLARDVAGHGRRVGTVHAARLGTTRLRPADSGVIAAWRETFLPMVGDRLAPAVLTIALAILAFVAPLLLPPAALLLDLDTDLVIASCAPLALLIATRVALLLTQHHPPTTILWHPVTVGLMLVGQVAAVVDHVRGVQPHATGEATASG